MLTRFESGESFPHQCRHNNWAKSKSERGGVYTDLVGALTTGL